MHNVQKKNIHLNGTNSKDGIVYRKHGKLALPSDVMDGTEHMDNDNDFKSMDCHNDLENTNANILDEFEMVVGSIETPFSSLPLNLQKILMCIFLCSKV